MGLLKILRKIKLKEHQVRLLTLGLDNSGKTTIIKKKLIKECNSIKEMTIILSEYSFFKELNFYLKVFSLDLNIKVK